MSKATVRAYYQKWASGSKDSQMNFLDMLQRKAYNAGLQNRKFYAFDGMKSAKELNQMLVIADDLLSANEL